MFLWRRRSRTRGPTIYLHVGAMKTGTTFLQELLSANKDALADAGYLFPGRRWAEQDRAARDVLGFSGRDARLRAESEGMWQRLAGEMLAHRGAASVFSMEFLSFANRRRAARVVRSLDGAEVHVVLTVRDALAALPAQWQTLCRNGGTVPWTQFVDGVRDNVAGGGTGGGRAGRIFQRTQGIPRMLDAWGAAVPAERLHVVTVPPRGSDPMLLWERFAAVIGVDPGVCSTTVASSNPSLGFPSSELMRRINVELGKLPQSDYQHTLKGPLARRILAPRSRLERQPRLDAAGMETAATWNARVREAIVRSGARVVGDLDELPVRAPRPDADEAVFGEPTVAELLAAAATARDGLLDLVAERSQALAATGEPTPAYPTDEDRPTPAERWGSAHGRGSDPVAGAVAELTDLVRAAVELRRRIDTGPRRAAGSA